MNASISRRPRKHTSIQSFKPEFLESRTLLSAWSTVDNYQLATGKGAISEAMAVDASGNVFAAGYAGDSAGHNHGIVREKPAGGTSWTTIEDYSVSGVNVAFYAAAVDGAGDLFVGGQAADSTGKSQWLVMEKPASSSSFSIVDSYATSGGGMAEGLAVDPAGNVFAAGQTVITTTGKGNKTTRTSHWTVRKQTGGQGAFSTVDNAISSTTNPPYAWAVTSISTGASAGLYVVGEGTSNNWLVRKSTDAGASWTTVDNFQYSSTPNSVAEEVAGDASGNIYVVGEGWNAVGSIQHWLVRKSPDGGASWSTVDDFTNGGNLNDAEAIGTDLAGNVYVGGSGRDSSGVYHNLIRSNAGGSRTTVSDIPSPAGNCGTFALSVDPSGNIYGAGNVRDSSGVYHWIVQSSTGPAAPASAAPAAVAAVFSSTQITTATDPTDIFHHRKHRK